MDTKLKRWVFHYVPGYCRCWYKVVSLRYWGRKNLSVFYGMKMVKGRRRPFVNYSRGQVGPTWPERG